MASGNLIHPPQFGGLIPRSIDEFDTPWEIYEVPKFDNWSDIGNPSPSSWVLAMEEWAALNVKSSVWHYTCRADPIPYGCRLFQFHQVIETEYGQCLHYKPRHGYADFPLQQVDLIFRRVPPAMLLDWDLKVEKEEVFARVYSAMSGTQLQEIRYERDYRITWKRFQEDLRMNMVQKGQISTARDFKLVTDNDEVIAPHRLLFPPLRTSAHIEAKERMKPQKASDSKKQSKASAEKQGMKKPAAVKQIIQTPSVNHGMKKPAAVKQIVEKPVKQGMKKPAAVKKGMKRPVVHL